MIEVIVNVRDAVFAALVAWTGVGDSEPAQPAKDQDMKRGKPAPIEKPVQQQPALGRRRGRLGARALLRGRAVGGGGGWVMPTPR